MIEFHAYTSFAKPRLHLWNEDSAFHVTLPPQEVAETGWARFAHRGCEPLGEATRFMMVDEAGGHQRWEREIFRRRLPLTGTGRPASAVWFFEDTRRVATIAPTAVADLGVRIHLVTAERYREAELFIWDPRTPDHRFWLPIDDIDGDGPIWTVPPSLTQSGFFHFKAKQRGLPDHEAYEPDAANRAWTSSDGAEIWTHAESSPVLRDRPQTLSLRLHYRHEWGPDVVPTLQVQEEGSGLIVDAVGSPDADEGWSTHSADLYPDLTYAVRAFHRLPGGAVEWEDHRARRRFTPVDESETFLLAGVPRTFAERPQQQATLPITVVDPPPYSQLGKPLNAHVWLGYARMPLATPVPVAPDGTLEITTYPDVPTNIKLFDANNRWEVIEAHSVVADGRGAAAPLTLVPERPPLLAEPPPDGQFADPPFAIRRPGAWADGDAIRFALHAPLKARVRLIGEWTGWMDSPIEMRSTTDGTYWWATVPIAEIAAGLPPEAEGDYHGARYQFVLNDGERVRDPAADWTDNAAPAQADRTSRLVRHDRFRWSDFGWSRPAWDHLVIYQLHASRFTDRFTDLPPLLRVAREIDSQAGYLTGLGITAIQLLPVNEVGSTNSWGYDPAFFFAVEEDYGGPDALKTLVDTCHRHGIAVIVDVVFNHTGHQDNVLWRTARESFFDGDTAWGAMINFDHPQSVHFFQQNLVYLAREFHIDGFRLDHTHTIRYAHHTGAFVRTPGSGGGWNFLHALRHALDVEIGGGCILIAEHLPNEWDLTNFGGPMDSQWCDDFHDRLVDACRGWHVMPALATAMQISHTHCQQWYNVTNYPESHDEVGNVNDRVANVAGFGRGLRMAKVATAAAFLARGIPMSFMGLESGEHRQFAFGSSEPLPVSDYLAEDDRHRLRAWFRAMALLHRDTRIKGPSPLGVRMAEGQTLAFTRGEGEEFYVLLNFGGWSGHRSLTDLNLPGGDYRELWNSTWPEFSVQQEDERQVDNGGHDSRLNHGVGLNVPAYAAVVLQRW